MKAQTRFYKIKNKKSKKKFFMTFRTNPPSSFKLIGAFLFEINLELKFGERIGFEEFFVILSRNVAYRLRRSNKEAGVSILTAKSAVKKLHRGYAHSRYPVVFGLDLIG